MGNGPSITKLSDDNPYGGTTDAPDTERFWNRPKFQNWQADCGQGDLRHDALVCYSEPHWQNQVFAIKSSAARSAEMMLFSAQGTMNNIEQACGAGTFDRVWPLFYKNPAKAAEMMDINNFLAQNPDVKCADQLKSVEPLSKSAFQFMNQTRDTLMQQWSTELFLHDFQELGSYSNAGKFPNAQNIGDFKWTSKSFAPRNTTDSVTLGFKNTVQQTTDHLVNWQKDPGFHLSVLGDGLQIELQNMGIFQYGGYPYDVGNLVDPGFIGDPYWDYQTREAAQVVAFGFTAEQGVPPPPKQQPPSTVAGYTGVLPYLQEAFNQGNPVLHQRIVYGGAGRDYRDPCDAKGILEEIIPVVFGAVGVIGPSILLPDSLGTTMMSITAGTALYVAGQDFFGVDAVEHTIEGNHSRANRAAAILTIGVPASGVFMLFELTDLPLPPDSKYPIALLAGAGCYYFFSSTIAITLDVGGGIFSILTAPFAWLMRTLTLLFNDCYISHWEKTDSNCLCSEAVATGGKATIIPQLLDTYYATTGEQRRMRSACLQAEMQRGPWKSTGYDQNVISECDTGNNYMNNPLACFDAGAWASLDPTVISSTQGATKDWLDRNPIAYTMHDQIFHCLDASNPSFLPPASSADVACQAKYGEHYRNDPAGGGCKNFINPGPSADDPIGMQAPGFGDVAGASNSCAIQ